MTFNLYCRRRRRILLSIGSDAVFYSSNALGITRPGILFIILFCFALQAINPVNSEPLKLEYTSPPSPDMPAKSIEIKEPRGELSLSTALSLALSHNPALTVAAREVRAQDGIVQQAGLLPNPVFGVSAQNFANSRLQGVDGDALNWSLSQTVLLGGKRAKAIRVAELDRELAVWDYESKRMDVLTEVVLSFIGLIKAQQGLKLADGLVTLADHMMEVVTARVKFGETSPVDETRARVSLASVQIEKQRAIRALAAARKRLAATWGSTSPIFEVAQGQLETAKPIPSFSALMERIAQNPDLARWASETVQRQASIQLAESRAIPNLTVSLGVQQYLKTGDNAVGAGISIPLPLFNRNQGNVLQANRRFDKAVDRQRETQVLISTTLNTIYQRLSADYAELSILESTVLPGAQNAFEAVEEGYRRGRFNLLNMFDTQRTLFDAKIQHLSALASYHQSKTKIQRLIGAPVETAEYLGTVE